MLIPPRHFPSPCLQRRGMPTIFLHLGKFQPAEVGNFQPAETGEYSIGVDRWMSWSQAQSEVESGRGTVIGEYLSPKSGYRLWWTSEDISATSPYRCCFEEIPWGEAESSEFFEWCCSRFTNAEFGVGRLVDLESTDRKVVRQSLRVFSNAHRYVSACPLLSARAGR
jgi:hypothetical protein